MRKPRSGPKDHSQKPEQTQTNASAIKALLQEVQKANELLANSNRQVKDWRLPLRNGLMFGLGSAVGASLLFGILLAVLKPLEKIEALKQPIQQLATELNRKK